MACDEKTVSLAQTVFDHGRERRKEKDLQQLVPDNVHISTDHNMPD